MTQKYTFQFNKLVRDKAPEIMFAEGVESDMHIMDHESYAVALRRKIIEEAKEVSEALEHELLEELADVLEVVYCIGKAHGFSKEEIENERLKKSERRGGFEKRIFVKNATTGSGNRFFDYMKSKPEEYVEI